jgi:hypothetical protein
MKTVSFQNMNTQIFHKDNIVEFKEKHFTLAKPQMKKDQARLKKGAVKTVTLYKI